MYVNEIKKYAKALEGLSKMTNKGGSWNKTVMQCINGLTDALAGLKEEVNRRELLEEVNDNWGETEQERVAREQYW